MSESKHTPGPWAVVHTGTRTEVMAQGLLHPIAHVHRGGRSAGVGYCLPSKANAHLIAAAPELLEALEDALAFLDRPDITTYEWYKLAPEHVAMFRRAIRKAKGEPCQTS